MVKKSSKASKRSDRFKYTRRSKESIRARASQKGGDYDTYINEEIKFYKPREGKNIIRILPPMWKDEDGVDSDHYGYEIWCNYNVGPDKQSYLSLSKMKDEADPLAEALKEAQLDGDNKLAKALKPKMRVCIFVIDRLAEEEGPQLWAAPWTFDRDLAALCEDEDTKEVVYIDDPYGEDEDDGRDLRFYKTGSGLRTEYSPAKFKLLNVSPLHTDEDLMEEWLEYITDNPIPDCLNFYDYDHIKASFGGQIGRLDDDEDEDDDKDEDDKPRGRGRGRGRRDKDEDEDSKPRGRSRGRGRRDKDEEESEEEPEEEGEEESEEKEKPRRGRRSSSKSRRSKDEEEEYEDDGHEGEEEGEEESEEEDKKPRGRRGKVSDRIKKTNRRSKRD